MKGEEFRETLNSLGLTQAEAHSAARSEYSSNFGHDKTSACDQV